MGSHPLNLALRFILELSALFSMGLWGWKLETSPLPLLTAILIPLGAAILWGTFAVPDDPSRSGKAPVPVPGLVRLILEAVFFIGAVWMLFHLHYPFPAIALGCLVTFHYGLSFDRIVWLLKKGAK